MKLLQSVSLKIVSLVGETWWNDHRAFSLWRVEYIYIHIYTHRHTIFWTSPCFSAKHAFKDPRRISKKLHVQVCRRRIFAQSFGLHTAQMCVWSLWVVCPWTWRDHNKNMMYLQYWWFNNGIVQPQKKPDKRVAIPRLRAPFCAWENRRSPSWTSDLTWHLQWMNLLMLLSLKVRYTASKERWDHHFKMLFAVLRCEPDTNQMKRN